MSRTENWGQYPWVPEHGDSLIHPEDVRRFRALQPYEKVFQLLEERDRYLVLRYGSETFRVRPDLYRALKERPVFRFGDRVQDKSDPERVGVVQDIIWHPQYGRPIYFIEAGGKRLSHRYLGEELQPAR
jgi:hypothetical protein